ncbi:MAG: galactose mutarotase [Lachnospiraceae bacterium]|nr:galactose mutarotase [Lachnospiraceae bacterium]
MSVSVSEFGSLDDGSKATLYTIKNNNGMIAEVTDFGANLVRLFVPDRKGNPDDIVLGFDDVKGYAENPSYFGSTIGRIANRIGDAKFTLNGVNYELEVNDGPNNLHSSFDNGYNKRFFNAHINGDGSVTFSLSSPDGDQGFPGNLEMSVTYKLTDDNELVLSYTGRSDKDTIFNPTNHSYFNLSGHDSGKAMGLKLQLVSKELTPVREGSIPTGDFMKLEGTPFDFSELTVIGDRIDEENELLKIGKGYDINYVIDKKEGEYGRAALVVDEESGRTMEVFTDLPGVQFYAGNCIATQQGKGGVTYSKRHAICLETQFYPDAINHDAFTKPILKAGEEFKSTTTYKFGIC